MSRLLPIMTVQASPVAWDVEATWVKFESDLRELKAMVPQTRLFLWPELYLAALGPISSKPGPGYTVARIAESVPGPLTERLGALAAELHVWLVPGSFYERGEDGSIYNTAVAISPEGKMAARYRKIFPWRPWERTAAGDEFVVFDIEGVGRAGLMICYDGWFPEVPRHLAWMGAQVILQPTATGTSDRDQEVVLARANAIVNQVFVVNVNMGGRPGPGRSVIVDPEGHLLQLAGDGEEYQTDVLDLDAVTKIREHGTVGLNRMWAQLEKEGGSLSLPLYQRSLEPAVEDGGRRT
jgi:predicted amidohydrolase